MLLIMNREDFLLEISKTLIKHKVEKLTKLVVDAAMAIPELINLSFYPKEEIAFRAAWILEYVEIESPACFLPYIQDFIGVYPQQKNRSCQRHFTKMMKRITDSRPQ